MNSSIHHRLDGLEPDNLLAFLALIGLLRALEAVDEAQPEDERIFPRCSWEIGAPPMRPNLFFTRAITPNEIAERAAAGIATLAAVHDFGVQRDLNYPREVCRSLLEEAARAAAPGATARIELLASLMSDAAIKDEKTQVIDPTPLCLLFGQGHQHFLERLCSVPRELYSSLPTKDPGKVDSLASECLADALFEPWQRKDQTPSFRWDPDEAVRYALMAGDPTDPAFKRGTQHGANRLAAIGLSSLTLVPQMRAGRVRPAVIGGAHATDGSFTFAWPIWKDSATLTAIRALLAHPQLRSPGGLRHLGVDYVMETRRISVGKFLNFTRARVIEQTPVNVG